MPAWETVKDHLRLTIAAQLEPLTATAPHWDALITPQPAYSEAVYAIGGGLVVLFWFARKSKHPELKMGPVCSEFAFLLVSTIIPLMIQISGLINQLGLIITVEHLVLLVWFGYFFVKRT